MFRRLSLLNGLAILGVVCNHAAGWGLFSMVFWANRYRPVAVPSYDHIGTLPYFGLISIRHLTAFAVPSFLFVTGFFVAYAARGSQSKLSWKVVLTRLKNLLIPYLIWSVLIFISEALQGRSDTAFGYLTRILLGRAHVVYFYIPLLCQFYLLSPLVVPLAKTRACLLLVVAALLQVSALGLRYLSVFGIEIPGLMAVIDLSFPMYCFFFVSGIVSGFHLPKLKEWLTKARWGLLTAAVILCVLTMVESEVVYRLTGLRRGAGPTTIPASMYTTAFIFTFLAFQNVSIPFPKQLAFLGTSSYSIYLIHPIVLEFVARATQKFTPWVLAYQALFQPLLIIPAVGVPLLLMTAVSRSPLRRFRRYLFG